MDSGALLERLIAQNPASFNFHVPLSDGGVLLGASPELLLRKEGDSFSSLPLAARPGVSRTTCWIAKRATSCWRPVKIATSTSW
ncbi:Isochorismate synthase entC [Raoultella terrigena]|uniref:Isochorismate synthase entC n=1 Tax=Raoultella terrigena TaxID=577 RepID=A0A4U9DFN8_RAOTE|nr:Isochorismate synthase entC [Raoultella terrigena]